MTYGSRLQQVNRMVLEKVREVRILGDEPTEENCELAHVWLRAIAKIASTHIQQLQISELLREVSKKKLQMSQRQVAMRVEAELLEAQVRERKERAAMLMRSPLSADEHTMSWLPGAQAGHWFITTAVRELPEECTELDGEIHVLTNMSIMGQPCQSQSEGGVSSVWIHVLVSAAGVVTERVNLKSPAPNLTQAQSSVPSGNMRLFYTFSDSAFWKKKFLHRSLTRDLQSYSEWHREQAGDSPMKRLSSITLLGSPVPLVDLDAAVAPVASSVAADWLQSCPSSDVKTWLLSCRSPTAAITGVVGILMA